jgi:4-alpha-glucanotransferase
VTPGDIEKHYADAFGKRHAVPRKSLDAIRQAMQRRSSGGPGPRPGSRPDLSGPAGPADDVIVTTEGQEIAIGPAEVRLEDGTTLRVDAALPRDVPAGYHDVRRRDKTTARLIVAPAACHLPDDFSAWGWAIQLYAARSRRSWGIGDLADLRRLARWAGKEGAGIAMVNPLAAPAPILPQQPSPYFPSSRRFRSPLYLRIEEVEGAETLGDLSEIAMRGRALNRDRLIRRDDVFRLKLGALERIWEIVRRRENPAFDRFVAGQGDSLREFATFCALAEEFNTGWHGWPSELRHPSSPAVRNAARRRPMADRIRFHQWLQFQVDRQLQRASKIVPVMQDLPIGFDADGADAWAFQDVLADGITVGAPPDEFNTKGQDWGLPPFVPRALRAHGYRPFIETIRACLRHAGGLRIDHVMGLFRLFWIPAGMQPADGAYVRSYADDLLAIVALESRRARAVIVGEDLGTVEEAAREQLMAHRVLSYRLIWFEKTAPAKFPEDALAAVTTHDLPTIAGMWTGSDLAAQKQLGLSPNEKGLREIHQRIARVTKTTARTPLTTVIGRVHEALGEAPSRILTATLEDAMAVEERPNMPATSDEWPNWSIALPRPIETLEKDPLARRITRALKR